MRGPGCEPGAVGATRRGAGQRRLDARVGTRGPARVYLPRLMGASRSQQMVERPCQRGSIGLRGGGRRGAGGEGGLGFGESGGAEGGAEVDGALGVWAALGAAALAGEGAGEVCTAGGDVVAVAERLGEGERLAGESLGLGLGGAVAVAGQLGEVAGVEGDTLGTVEVAGERERLLVAGLGLVMATELV